MYNLLVSGSEWADSRDTLPEDRAFEHTSAELTAKFKPNGQVDTAALILLPTLFIQESSYHADYVVRVGRLVKIRISGRELRLEYILSAGMPALFNSQIKGLSSDLDIDDWEFSRTHWAVKEVDLFEVLYRNLQPQQPKARVFQLNDPENIEPSLISVMMPFAPKFNAVYSALTNAAKAVGMKCRRADDIWENPAIIQDVVSLIDRAKVVVCDCTDRNPNVFYEAGIAHTLGREVILITQSEADIPFDLRHLRYVQYLNNGEGLSDLTKRIQKRLSDLL
ncbi:MAG: hypothetical protein HGA97_13040 [Chlorobiaceae bacterium]|nr:hypothetical protein [Chlorobiaceae bacterium]